MNTSYFVRKALNLEEVRNVYYSNNGNTKGQQFIVEKVVELSRDDFEKFSDNILNEMDFIRENMGIMYIDKDDVAHCLLVKTLEAEGGYLVDNQGYEYARYIAYCPDSQAAMQKPKTPARA
ncbi:MAG: hypothetical protein HN368_09610 [Spirochaetales bacterium]|jgi:hypothetical protein|nr:hypothetical protein [Spirochaetales bacterium]